MLVISIGAAGLFVYAWWRNGRRSALQGVRWGGNMLWSLLPRLLLGFAVAGLVQVLVPEAVVLQVMGKETGIQGVLVGTALGTVAPGGPFIWYPVAASLLQAGAGVGAIVAFLVAWSATNIYVLLVWRIPFLGTSLSVALMIAALATPVLAGLMAPPVFDWLVVLIGA